MTRGKARAPAKARAKTPAKVPAKSKTPAVEPANTPEPNQELAKLVEPLAPNALKLALDIIDNATIKGADAQLVIQLKLELARVAGVQREQQ